MSDEYLDDFVVRGFYSPQPFPYPLALRFKQSYHPDARDRDSQFDYMVDLSEDLVKYLAMVLASNYRHNNPSQSHADAEVIRALKGLNQPMFGRWLALLQKLVAYYQLSPTNLLVPEVSSFYQAKAEVGMIACYEYFRNTYTIHNENVETKGDFLEFLLEHRNDVTHPRGMTNRQKQRSMSKLKPALHELFFGLQFLTSYSLVYLSRVTVVRMQKKYDHEIVTMMGDEVREVGKVDKYEQTTERQPGWFYLSEQGYSYNPIFDLQPFLMYVQCEKCIEQTDEDVERLFVFDGYEKPSNTTPGVLKYYGPETHCRHRHQLEDEEGWLTWLLTKLTYNCFKPQLCKLERCHPRAAAQQTLHQPVLQDRLPAATA